MRSEESQGSRARRRASGRRVLAVLTGTLLGLSLTATPHVGAQDEPSAAASEGSMKDGSTSVGESSGPIGEATSGSMRSGPLHDISRSVRDGKDSSMLSGPVGERGSGPVRDGRSVYGRGPMGAASNGAVTQPHGMAPLRMDRPVSDDEMRQLADELRGIQPLP